MSESESTPSESNPKETIKSEESTQFLHATSDEDTCKAILRDGLRCHRNGLSGVVVKVDRQESLEDSIDRYLGRHKGGQYIVVVQIPGLPPELKAILNNKNSELALDVTVGGLLVEELPKERKLERYGYYLSTKYIKGYFDGVNKRFIVNPQFSPVLAESEQEKVRRVLENLTSDSYYEFQQL